MHGGTISAAVFATRFARSTRCEAQADVCRAQGEWGRAQGSARLSRSAGAPMGGLTRAKALAFTNPLESTNGPVPDLAGGGAGRPDLRGVVRPLRPPDPLHAAQQ